MNIQPVTSKASKADEMQTLRKVAKLFEPNTYLHDLFSEKFLGWVEEKLKNDFPPEWYETLEQLWNENNELRKTLRENEDDYIRRCRIDEQNMIALQAKIQQAEQMRENTQTLYSRLTDAYGDLQMEHARNCQELEFARNEILRLKAKIYDLTVKE